MKQIESEGQDKDIGFARLQEEIAALGKMRVEAEQRAKKFESRFREAVKEAEELREQMAEMAEGGN